MCVMPEPKKPEKNIEKLPLTVEQNLSRHKYGQSLKGLFLRSDMGLEVLILVAVDIF